LGYAMLMPDWLHNREASYVLAAYGAAAIILLGLLFFSWQAWRCRQGEWQKLQNKRPKRS
jgi:DMSO/TMAO reductase YedYZ heme-binding membrane subunit